MGLVTFRLFFSLESVNIFMKCDGCKILFTYGLVKIGDSKEYEIERINENFCCNDAKDKRYNEIREDIKNSISRYLEKLNKNQWQIIEILKNLDILVDKLITNTEKNKNAKCEALELIISKRDSISDLERALDKMVCC